MMMPWLQVMEMQYPGLECQINHRHPLNHPGWSSNHAPQVEETVEEGVHTLEENNKGANVNYSLDNKKKDAEVESMLSDHKLLWRCFGTWLGSPKFMQLIDSCQIHLRKVLW